MAATARQFKVTEEDLESSGGGGAYAELEVPGDFPCYLADVIDYDKRDQGKSHGWIFRYMVETPSGAGVKFDSYLSFGQNARWKLLQVLAAHGVDVSEGILNCDPNDLVGDMMIAHIDFPRDDAGNPSSDFRELQEVFPVSSTPAYADDDEVEEGPEDPDIL